MGVLRVVRVAVDVFDIVGIMSVVTMCVVSCVDVGVDHTGIGVVVVGVDVGVDVGVYVVGTGDGGDVVAIVFALFCCWWCCCVCVNMCAVSIVVDGFGSVVDADVVSADTANVGDVCVGDVDVYIVVGVYEIYDCDDVVGIRYFVVNIASVVTHIIRVTVDSVYVLSVC